MGLQRRADRGGLVQPSGAPPRLKITRDGSGKLEVHGPEDLDPAEARPAVEAGERPPQLDDRGGGPSRDVSASDGV